VDGAPPASHYGPWLSWLGVKKESPCWKKQPRSWPGQELGTSLRRCGRRSDARHPLREGLDIAVRCGAEALAARARDELLATGAQLRRERLTGPDALTPSERRVARLAAQGRTNSEIAQALFLTRRTVETHLTHAYQKLGISSREDLAALID
jgi:DNA-binding CsgD family transcriptional regulator